MPRPPRGLVVDDNQLNRDLLEGYLRALGYETVTATDGDEAWAILERDGGDIDVVLLDRRMPRMDGMEVLARIKASPDLQGLPVVMQTAADSQQEIIDGIRAGVFYYLTKPFQPEILMSVTAAAVADHARYRRLKQGVDRQAAALRHLDSGRFRFRTLAEAGDMAVALAATMPDPRRQVIGLSELMTNAVEHGNLGITYAEKSELLARKALEAEVAARLDDPAYRDRMVEVLFENRPDRIVLTITDEGEGFDWRRFLEMDAQRVFDAHGRGIALARSISFDTVEYRGRGNEVVATVVKDEDLPDRPATTVVELPASDAAGFRMSAPDHRRLASVQQDLRDTREDLESYRARLTEDLEAARRMQQDLLPDMAVLHSLEARHGLRFASHFETSSELGGDLFGVHPIDDSSFGLWTLDFSGHGISAALNTFRLHSLLPGVADHRHDPGGYLAAWNRRLSGLLATAQYATALYGVVDTAAHVFRYAAAAAPAPLLADPATGTVIAGDGTGLPLGVDGGGGAYDTRDMPFRPGQVLLLYSDALLECQPEDGPPLGRDGVAALLRDAVRAQGHDVTLDAVLGPFLSRVARPFSDDLTALLCVRHPQP
ncbi:SpoIIE family protein phosphatase [Roseospira navarrensis]|uniref:SpoIIE family protein phosphatase n=1 Tax=Roseospira navarrensis TaxID=140058 RepID=A0A7X2D480_9PROT|nr:SpoIIE family protein phosphatase [Roseospira navarrensis]MQX37581.1 SpoIIE family protein phosphatase [Roseospira navarrensis]